MNAMDIIVEELIKQEMVEIGKEHEEMGIEPYDSD